jgi:hypothetical protein
MSCYKENEAGKASTIAYHDKMKEKVKVMRLASLPPLFTNPAQTHQALTFSYPMQ